MLSKHATHGEPVVTVVVVQVRIVRIEVEVLPVIDIVRTQHRGPNVTVVSAIVK